MHDMHDKVIERAVDNVDEVKAAVELATMTVHEELHELVELTFTEYDSTPSGAIR